MAPEQPEQPEQQGTPGTRKALIAGAVALALTGAGAAWAWSAASASPAPSTSQSASPSASPSGSASAKDGKQAKPDKAQRLQFEHSESVVRKADGTFQTALEQRGTVEAVSSTSITVKSDDGFSQEYAVTADTKVTTLRPAGGSGSSGGSDSGSTDDGGTRLRPTDGTIADIAKGDVVRISGVKDGTKATARRVVEGDGTGPAQGHNGNGSGGSGMGNGTGKGTAATPGVGA